jgi:hypothetical protein
MPRRREAGRRACAGPARRDRYARDRQIVRSCRSGTSSGRAINGNQNGPLSRGGAGPKFDKSFGCPVRILSIDGSATSRPSREMVSGETLSTLT